MAKKVLFGCESVYQLFNSIILASTTFYDDNCDVVLSSQTPWRDELLKNLYKANVFKTISRFDAKSLNDRFFSLSRQEQLRQYRNPDEYFGDTSISDEEHDIMCFPIDHIPWMLHYHRSVLRGGRPEVHLYDEGVRSYTMPIHQAECQPYAKNAYGKDSFFNAIKVVHLHSPELYSNGRQPFQIVPIPKIVANNHLKEIVISIFGRENLPSQRYIYLEDFFFADRCVSNDMELFKLFSKIVGVENIIVKRHPRDDENRFAFIGCKEFETSVVPWEVQLLINDYSHKVLISVSSTSLLTPVMIFDYPFHVISLEKMFKGVNPTHSDVAFKRFMGKFRGAANKTNIRFHTPENVEELQDVITYLGMVQP